MKFVRQFIVLLLALPSIFSLSCLDANGNQLDWWVYIKVPNSIYENTTYFAMYYDSTMSSSDFSYISTRIDQQGNALYNTIIGTQSSNYELIAWNDENPITNQTTSAPTAHSKGVIALDPSASTGFYMQHSLPKFLNIVNNQIDPTIADSELTYGQNLMCLSVTASTLDAIAQQLLIIDAQVYFTQGLTQSYPNLYLFGTSNYTTSTAFLNQNFSTIQGLNIQMFSKSGYFPSDQIFDDVMVPILSQSLYCETWGRPYQNASCDLTSSDYFVEEIIDLNFSQSGVAWKCTKDHSKWAISSSSSNPYVCFGDLNKMTSQAKRGGSYYCMLNNNLWNILTTAITSTQNCSSTEIYQEKKTLQQLIYEALNK